MLQSTSKRLSVVLVLAALSIPLLSAAFSSQAYADAAAVAWDGGGDGSSWSDPDNWSGDTLPSSGDTITIDGNGAMSSSVILDINFSLDPSGSITIDSDDSLTITSVTLQTSGTIINSGTIDNFGSILNTGTINIIGGTINIDGGIQNTGGIFGEGIFNIGLTGQVFNDDEIDIGGSINNAGLIFTGGSILIGSGTFINTGNLWNGGFFQNEAAVTNTGVIDNGPSFRPLHTGEILNAGIITNSGTFDNSGLLTNFKNAIDHGMIVNEADFSSSGIFFNNGGTITNNANLTNSGTITNQGSFFEGEITNNDQITNSGTIDNYDIFTNTGTIDNTGNINNKCGGTFIDTGSINGNPVNEEPCDTDNDGVPDDLDECPTVPGSAENNGCPVSEPVGGEILSTSAVSLFVAGAGANALWIIPVVGGAAAVALWQHKGKKE